MNMEVPDGLSRRLINSDRPAEGRVERPEARWPNATAPCTRGHGVYWRFRISPAIRTIRVYRR
jgi:hypothetical protein